MEPLQLGEIEVIRVEEGWLSFSRDFFFPDQSAEDFLRHKEWTMPRFISEDLRLNLSVHTFILRTRHHTILVDTCVGNDKERPMKQMNRLQTDFLGRLAKAGVTPGDVDYVFCTHFHSDHVGWNTRLENGRWVPTFPKAKYLFHRPEFEYYMNLPDDEKPASLLDSVVPIHEAGQAELVDGDHAIGDGILLEPTPGHTVGHCCVHITGGGRDAVITGDMIHSPIQVAEPQWKTGVCSDPDLAVKTRTEFIRKYADGPTLILGTHFGAPTACHIVSEGDSHRPRFLGE